MADYKTENINGEYVLYKGKPLVRNGNMLRYGDMSEPYVLDLLILTPSKSPVGNGDEVPGLIFAQVNSTDLSKSPAERLYKQIEANGIYNALELALPWLETAIKEAKK